MWRSGRGHSGRRSSSERRPSEREEEKEGRGGLAVGLVLVVGGEGVGCPAVGDE